jgi:TolA-binding protein
MKMEDYEESINLLSGLIQEYPDERAIRPEAMYWLAESYFRNGDNVKAYQTFKKLTWDYPESKWAKIARGRLTEEVFARMDEM